MIITNYGLCVTLNYVSSIIFALVLVILYGVVTAKFDSTTGFACNIIVIGIIIFLYLFYPDMANKYIILGVLLSEVILKLLAFL